MRGDGSRKIAPTDSSPRSQINRTNVRADEGRLFIRAVPAKRPIQEHCRSGTADHKTGKTSAGSFSRRWRAHDECVQGFAGQASTAGDDAWR
jgi:hypothetical protein